MHESPFPRITESTPAMAYRSEDYVDNGERTWLERPDQAVESLMRAMRLSPTDVFLFSIMTTMAAAH